MIILSNDNSCATYRFFGRWGRGLKGFDRTIMSDNLAISVAAGSPDVEFFLKQVPIDGQLRTVLTAYVMDIAGEDEPQTSVGVKSSHRPVDTIFIQRKTAKVTLLTAGL